MFTLRTEYLHPVCSHAKSNISTKPRNAISKYHEFNTTVNTVQYISQYNTTLGLYKGNTAMTQCLYSSMIHTRLSMPYTAAIIAVHSCYLHISSVIDELQSLVVQSLTSMQITDQRIDWLSPTLVVMIYSEAKGPCLSKGSVRCSGVPWTPMPVSATHS